MTDMFDVTIIGSGPGGYVCAIRCAQLGMKTAVIEKEATPGGTCLNIGCIPSKALLHTSEMFHQAQHQFKRFGINVENTKLDLKKMMQFKNQCVTANVKGVEFLLKKNKIQYFNGIAQIEDKNTVRIQSEKKEAQSISTKNIIIATGSESAQLPGITIDEKHIVSSTGALQFEQVPNHLVVIGAGVIGLELGSVWKRLGAQVTVIEFLDRILPEIDSEIARNFLTILKKQGMNVILSTKVTRADRQKDNTIAITIEDSHQKVDHITADKVLVCIGRKPHTDGLNLERIGVATNEKGCIITDTDYQTSIEGIYAIGDVIAGPMLAHKAEDEGIALAEILAGQKPHVNYQAIPGVVYTHPEVAYVGKTEDQLRGENATYHVGKFPLTANGRARAINATDGLVKILADAQNDTVRGVHIIAPNAGDIIHEAVTIMEFAGSAEDIARICHAHPTLSEAMREAALATDRRAIHM